MLRRRFLTRLGVWVSALVGGIPFSTAAFAASAPAYHSPVRRRLLQGITDREAARRVGQAFLDQFSSRRAAVEWVDGQLAALESALTGTRSIDLGIAVDEKRDADFRNGRTVYLRGWVLSHCEVLPSAIVALEEDGGGSSAD